MKAPEDKLYINLFKGVYNVCSYPVGNAQEYIRTDAFIEKLESFLNKKEDRDSYTIGYIKRHLEEIIKEIGL